MIKRQEKNGNLALLWREKAEAGKAKKNWGKNTRKSVSEYKNFFFQIIKIIL